MGDLSVDKFLKEDGLHKWRYLIDMAANDDCEAIDILITERRDAISAEIEKDLKKGHKKEDPIVIKEEKQVPIVKKKKNKLMGRVTILVVQKNQKQMRQIQQMKRQIPTVNPKSVGEN